MSSARSIGVLTVLNIGVAIIGLATSVVTAHYFGTTRTLEVFFAASTLQSLMLSISQSGQVSEVLIPVYHRLKHAEGLDSAQRAYSVVTNWMMIWLAGLTAAMWLLAPVLADLMVPGFDEASRAATATMFRWLVPLLPLQVFLSLLGGVSNAEKWFGKPELFSFVSQVVGLGFTVAFAAKLGTWVLVFATWANQLLLLGGFILILRQLGYRHRFVLRHPGCPVLPLFRQLGTTLGYVLCTQLYTFALNAGISLLPQGTYAVFRYVMVLYSKTNGILLRPVSIVFFTHFSEAFAAGSEKVRVLLQLALSRMLTTSALALVVACVAAPGAVRALWGGRLFQSGQLELSGNLLMLLMALLVPSGFAQVVRKLVISAGCITRLYVAMALVQIASASLAYWLPKQYGVAGAVAVLIFNSVLLAGACEVLLVYARPGLVAFFAWGEVWRWGLAGGLAWLIGALVAHAEGSYLPAGRLWLGLSVCVAASVAAAGALGLAWLLRIEDIRRLAAFVQSRLRAVPLGRVAAV